MKARGRLHNGLSMLDINAKGTLHMYAVYLSAPAVEKRHLLIKNLVHAETIESREWKCTDAGLGWPKSSHRLCRKSIPEVFRPLSHIVLATALTRSIDFSPISL